MKTIRENYDERSFFKAKEQYINNDIVFKIVELETSLTSLLWRHKSIHQSAIYIQFTIYIGLWVYFS